jgi:hypothetical protein
MVVCPVLRGFGEAQQRTSRTTIDEGQQRKSDTGVPLVAALPSLLRRFSTAAGRANGTPCRWAISTIFVRILAFPVQLERPDLSRHVAQFEPFAVTSHDLAA